MASQMRKVSQATQRRRCSAWLAGACLVVVWMLEEQAEIEAPPLSGVQVDVILARPRRHVA